MHTLINTNNKINSAISFDSCKGYVYMFKSEYKELEEGYDAVKDIDEW